MPSRYLLALTISCAAYADPGDVFFVDAGNDSAIQDGLSWATAFSELEAGIEKARTSFGGEVWVALGIYDEARANAGALRLRPNVDVYGGFAGGEVSRNQRNPRTNVTIIDGAAANAGDPAETVVVGASNCILDGFTIRGGEGDSGAGMLNVGVSPQIINCVFTTNTATNFGGAMLNVDGAAPRIVDTVFTNNTADGNGGAVGNFGSAAVFEGCRFSINDGGDAGGAMFNLEQSNTIITRCTFEKNTASSGGAIFNETSSPSIKASIFLQNTVPQFGGAIFNDNDSDTLAINCVFAKNTSMLGGAAISSLTSTMTAVNCTFADNTSPTPGAALFNNQSTTNVLNAIFWYNSDPPFFNVDSFTEIRWSNVGGSDPGPENIAVEPRFMNREGNDYALAPDSPSIDAGTLNGAPVADLLGVIRPQGIGIDQGAYESTIIQPPVDGGFDCHGLINGILTGGKSTTRNADMGLLLGVAALLCVLKNSFRR